MEDSDPQDTVNKKKASPAITPTYSHCTERVNQGRTQQTPCWDEAESRETKQQKFIVQSTKEKEAAQRGNPGDL